MKKKIEVVAAVIINKNLIFCAQRKLNGPLAGKWEFPGGKIENGEKREEALIREIKEELHSELIIKKYLTTIEHEYDSFIIVMHAFLCTVKSTNFILNDHIDAQWLSSFQLDNVDWAAADIPIVEMIKTIKLENEHEF